MSSPSAEYVPPKRWKTVLLIILNILPFFSLKLQPMCTSFSLSPFFPLMSHARMYPEDMKQSISASWMQRNISFLILHYIWKSNFYVPGTHTAAAFLFLSLFDTHIHTHHLNIHESSPFMLCCGSPNKWIISGCVAFPRWYYRWLECRPPDAQEHMKWLFVYMCVFCMYACVCDTPGLAIHCPLSPSQSWWASLCLFE